MALRLKAKGKWRQVSSDALKGFSDLISIQELTDYEIVREPVKIGKSSRTKDDKKKRSEEEVRDDTDTQKKRKQSKMRKLGIDAVSSGNAEPPAKRLKKEEGDVAGDETAKNEDSADKLVIKKKKKKRKKGKKSESATVEEEQDPRDHSSDDDQRESEVQSEMASAKNDVKRKKKRNKKKGRKTLLTTDLKIVEQVQEEKQSALHDPVTDMSKWSGLFVPDVVLRNLAELGFSAPTLVQERCLPVAIKGNVDIVVAAETGSGKTLAFGIPLIDRILNCRKKAEENSHSSDEDENGEEAGDDKEVAEDEEDMETSDADDEDVTEPDSSEVEDEEADEEEASDGEDEVDKDQVKDDKEDASDEEVEENDAEDEDDAINRDEEDGVEDEDAEGDHPLYALVLTPTRELAFQIRDHLRSVSKDTDIRCQVLVGGMSIQKQSRLLDRCPEIVVATPGRLWDIFKQGNRHLRKMKDIQCLVIDEADRMVERFHFEQLSSILAELNQKDGSRDHRQTFILSATLTYVPPKPQRVKFAKKDFKEMSPKDKLESLCSQIGIREKPKIIDLTPQQRTALKLTEMRLNFTAVEEKDLHLYCFLKEYPGRTIVFANSIDCVWRLMRLLSLLKMAPLRLFADMQQKQRLKSLETFKANPQSLLLATDVAARGLDIAGIDHVIHYEVPRTTESYIHRSGRTARANSEGFSILFVGPKEAGNYRKLMKALDRDDLPVFPTNDGMLWAAKERVTLARKVELHEFNSQKAKRKKLEEIAVDAGIEVEEKRPYDEDEEFRNAEERRALGWEQKQLQHLLSQSLISKSTHTKYPTKSGHMVWPYLEAETRGRAIEASQKKPTFSNRRSKKFAKKGKRK